MSEYADPCNLFCNRSSGINTHASLLSSFQYLPLAFSILILGPRPISALAMSKNPVQ